jgi:transposase InsO family protein
VPRPLSRVEAATEIRGSAETIWKIQTALEAAGVEFIPADAKSGAGVRLKQNVRGQLKTEARFGIGRWIGYYNAARPHSSFGGRTPDEVYAIEPTTEKTEKLAA